MKLVWKNGSGAAVSVEAFDGNTQSKALVMLEELLMNDWKAFGSDGDSITVFLNEDEAEDGENDANSPRTWTDEEMDRLNAKGRENWTQEDWEAYHYIENAAAEQRWYEQQD